MSGNVDEWCQDWMITDNSSYDEENRACGLEKHKCRVLRGGSWNKWHPNGINVPSIYSRNGDYPDEHSSEYGLRLVLPVTKENISS